MTSTHSLPLPEDPDSESLEPAPRGRPPHLRPGLVLLVGAGGAVGTALRYGLTLLFPGHGHALAAVLVINVLGAFVLGALLEGLARRGEDRGTRRAVRLGVGTGVLGGFTTYSTLAVGSVQAGGTTAAAAVGYPLLTLVLGLLAAGAGVLLSARCVEPESANGGRR